MNYETLSHPETFVKCCGIISPHGLEEKAICQAVGAYKEQVPKPVPFNSVCISPCEMYVMRTIAVYTYVVILVIDFDSIKEQTTV